MSGTTTDQDSRTELPSSASFLVDALPGQPPSTTKSIVQYAGHLPSHPPSTLNPRPDSHLWFWLIRSKHIADRQKFVIWFNGGPGCSSAEGALMEIGPLTPNPNSKPGKPIELIESKISWSEYANLLFIDQPAGTGYSFVNIGDDVRELAEAAEQVVVFMKNFYKVFPEFSKIDTYLAGESFAGQYIPYFAQAILDTAALSTPLMGLIMGNPWLNPKIQYLSYLDFAYEKGLIVKGTSSAKEAEKAFEKCEKALRRTTESSRILVSPCESGLQSILDAGAKVINGTKMTPVAYNITEMSAGAAIDWPTNNQNLKAYLIQNSTVTALHATAKIGQWTLCNDTIGKEMWVPKSAPSSTLMTGLLKKLKVIIYAGDQDYMCNSLGLNRSINDLEWNGQKGWGFKNNNNPINQDLDSKNDKRKGSDLQQQAVLPQDYYVNGTKIGTWTEARGLSFVKFDYASHLVPVDAAYAAHDMLLRFIGVDIIKAAGPMSSISSQIGDIEDERTGILMEILSNGTLINSDKLMVKLDPEQNESNLSLLGGPVPILETVEERQAYYGPRQTITLFLFLSSLILGLVLLFKWRRRRRRNRQPVLPIRKKNNKRKNKDHLKSICLESSPSRSRTSISRLSSTSSPTYHHHPRTNPNRTIVDDNNNDQAQSLVDHHHHHHQDQSSSLISSKNSTPIRASLSHHHSLSQSQIFSLEDDDEDV
ncbi:hypothetical protein Pst134EA_002609 [Puccinia striiformis f. sp. tritici]|uniref:hypothetical protein n=1 Tax=Puccinia striiformis f. sp. tritici TaxID=168172 RepID=UPI002008A684|nr:hypothetical protein Pst134EA_002609 [Puccinia striiformis f. sp. tritici]KAH9471981.1 hypothetical protein Pst134EA_002609 [Puccinia striiformis f. sp. tritici]